MGKVNVVLLVLVLIYSGKFDLQCMYFLVVGIVGIDLLQGMFGSVVWVCFLVDSDIVWEIDVCEVFVSWFNGFIGINMQGLGQKLLLDYKIEVFCVNEVLLQKVLVFFKGVVLDDNVIVWVYCVNYLSVLVNQLFFVV